MAYSQQTKNRSAAQPLYLEWAPNATTKPNKNDEKESKKKEEIGENNAEEEEVDEEKKPKKILVRNVPFQASLDELQQLFTAFGEIRALRLPKKV